jgi:L-fucose mutarotase
MLKNISPLISPELLMVLSEMGHGDRIVLGDANYPAVSGNARKVVRADGIGIPALLDAILELFPVDTFVEKPVALMEVVPGDDYKPEVWEEYREIFAKHGVGADRICYIERYRYYEEADSAYCVVATGERAKYGNIMLTKGVI